MTSTSFNTGYSLSRNSSKVIQPPGGQTADIFGRSNDQGGFSSASSQAGSDVASSRIRIDTDQQSVTSSTQMPVDGIVKQAGQQQLAGGQMSPTGSVGSSVASGGAGQLQQQSTASSLVGDAFQPTMQAVSQQQQQQHMIQQQQQQYKQQQLLQQQQQLQQQQLDATRTPKKTIPVLRRNPITGEILENPGERQQPVVRVRQPPGGHSSGIF